MKTHLVQIGNSKGIRIPQRLLGKVDLNGELELRAEANSLVIQSARRSRKVWSDAFAEMAKRGDDILLEDVQSLSHWDDKESEW